MSKLHGWQDQFVRGGSFACLVETAEWTWTCETGGLGWSVEVDTRVVEGVHRNTETHTDGRYLRPVDVDTRHQWW